MAINPVSEPPAPRQEQTTPNSAEQPGPFNDQIDKSYLPWAQAVIENLFGQQAKDEDIAVLATIMPIAKAAGLSDQEIVTVANKARKYDAYLDSGEFIEDAPEDLRRLHLRFRLFNLSTLDQQVASFADSRSVFGIALQSFVTEEINSRRVGLEYLLQQSNQKLVELEDYIQANYPGQVQVRPNPYQAERDQIHILTAKHIEQIEEEGVVGIHFVSGEGVQKIVQMAISRESLLRLGQKNIKTLLHELLHGCLEKNSAFDREQFIARLGEANYHRLDEGITEFTTQFVIEGYGISLLLRSDTPLDRRVELLKKQNVSYRDQVIAIHDELIPLIMQNNGFTRAEATVVVLAASREGMWEEMLNFAGDKAVVAIFDKLPVVVSDLTQEIDN